MALIWTRSRSSPRRSSWGGCPWDWRRPKLGKPWVSRKDLRTAKAQFAGKRLIILNYNIIAAFWVFKLYYFTKFSFVDYCVQHSVCKGHQDQFGVLSRIFIFLSVLRNFLFSLSEIEVLEYKFTKFFSVSLVSFIWFLFVYPLFQNLMSLLNTVSTNQRATLLFVWRQK